MPVPTVGDNVKVVERAKASTTKIVTEGVVTAVDETNNRLDFDIAKTKITDTANVNVRIDLVVPPLPTTPGSVVTDGNSVLMLRSDGRWYDQFGNARPISQMVNPAVVLDGEDVGA